MTGFKSILQTGGESRDIGLRIDEVSQIDQ